MFKLFDRQAEVSIRRARLPHWFQPGVTYFVTFRTADSIPRALHQQWHAKRREWLRQNGLDPDDGGWQAKLQKRSELHHAYHSSFTRAFMEYLDRGHGRCFLRDPKLAAFVSAALHQFDSDHYELGDFVVMPNHVHLLVCLRGTTEIGRQCRSWKTFTARKVNECIGRRGRFWQAESFDHLVRSESQFRYLQHYIADNPRHAGLRPGEYLYHSRPK
jgi:type I restriction enzyme R subunit